MEPRTPTRAWTASSPRRAWHAARRALIGLVLAASGVLLFAAPAGAAIAFRSSSSATATAATGVALPVPADTQVGDVMVASVAIGGTVNTTAMSAPSGWTLILTKLQGKAEQATFYRVASGSEPASYTFSMASGTWSLAGGIVTYSGADTTTPVDGTAKSGSGSSGSASCPSMTTTVANDRVILATADNNSVTFTPFGTERVDVAEASLASDDIADFNQAAAGSTGAQTVTPSNTTKPWVCITQALKPGSGSLAVSTSAAPTFTLTLNGTDQTPSYTLPVKVTDTRTSPTAGWQLQMNPTRFQTAGGAQLATTASTVTGVSNSCATDASSCTAPTNSVGYPVSIPTGTGTKVYNAAANTGTGIFTITPTVQVAVPANASAGSYTSTVTVSAVSGP